jgi:hypothetical protein
LSNWDGQKKNKKEKIYASHLNVKIKHLQNKISKLQEKPLPILDEIKGKNYVVH